MGLYKVRAFHPLLILKTYGKPILYPTYLAATEINTMAKRELGGGNNLFHLQLTVHHQEKSGQKAGGRN